MELLLKPIFMLLAVLTVAGYWLMPSSQWRKLWLLGVSFAFTLYIQPVTSLVLAILGVAAYLLGREFSRRKAKRGRWFILALVLAASYMIIVKTAARYFTISPQDGSLAYQLLVPMGLSFFTFKLLHYLTESWWKTLPEHRLDDLLLYLFFFPIMPAGPIERFERFHRTKLEAPQGEMVVWGVGRTIFGVFRKLVVAELFLRSVVLQQWIGAATPEGLLQAGGDPGTVKVWLSLVAYFLYCYIDFASLTDIALGVSALFGFRICENFDYPIISRNIGEFWRRWHMSLSTWVQRYIYFPLAGLTRLRSLPLVVAMITIGLWHSFTINRFLWGAYHGLGLVAFLVFQQTMRKRKGVVDFFRRFNFYPLSWLLTFLFVALGYCWVGSTSLSNAIKLMAIALGLNP